MKTGRKILAMTLGKTQINELCWRHCMTEETLLQRTNRFDRKDFVILFQLMKQSVRKLVHTRRFTTTVECIGPNIQNILRLS